MKKHRRLKAAAAAAVLILSMMLSGCQKIGTELSEMMMIQGIAIDKVQNGFRATIEMLNNEQNGSSNSSNSQQKSSLYYSAEGETISDALNAIVKKNGNKPMYAHVRVLVLSEKVARDGVTNMIDFFERSNNVRPTVLVVIARGKTAEQILSADLETQMVHSEMLENLLVVSNNSSLAAKVRMMDVINRILDDAGSLYLPAVTLEKAPKGKENFLLDGSAVFGINNQFLSYVDERTTQGFLFLNNKVENGNITVDLPKDRNASFYIKSSKTQIRVETTGEKPFYHIVVHLVCDLSEYSGGDMRSIEKKALNELKAAAENEIKIEIADALKMLQKDLHSDVLRFGKRLELTDPKLYRKDVGNWKNVFSAVGTSVEVDVRIRRTGEERFFTG